MSELKEYIITANSFEDLDSIYEDLESFSQGRYGCFPQRIVECLNRRHISRNTSYLLTDQEAFNISKDPRVEQISLGSDYIKDLEIIQDWTNSGQWAKVIDSEALPTDLNWTIRRTTLTDIPSDWYRGHELQGEPNGNLRLTGTVSTTLEGRNVDLIIVEPGQIYDTHIDFRDEFNNSRLITYNWLQHSNTLFGRANGTYSYVDTGSNNNFHTTGVAGLAAGTINGWAKKANLYYINIKGTSTSQNDDAINLFEAFDYIREFHRTKPINPLTGRKNPTIVNNSWSLGGGSSYYNVNNFNRIIFRGQVINGPFNDTNAGDYKWWQIGLGNWDIRTSANFFPYPNSLTADVIDAINDGIVVVVSGGNNQYPFSKQGNIDYNNKIEFKTPVNGVSELYYSRPQGIKNERVILVGALSWYKASPGTKNYSQNGRNITYYQTDGEEIDFDSAKGSGISVFAASQGLTARYLSINSRITLGDTSGAAPNVTGVLATLLERSPEWSQTDCLNYIKKTSTLGKISDASYVDSVSFGEYGLNGAPNSILYYTESLTYSSVAASPISVSIVPDKILINEGQSVTWNITTVGLADNTKIYWVNFGTANKTDLVEGVDGGIITVNSNKASITLTSIADFKTENTVESIAIKLYLNGAFIDEVASSLEVLINDTSKTPIVTKTYDVSAPAQAPEWSTIRYTLNTTNVSDGTILYYKIVGTNVDINDISSLNGFVSIYSQSATLDLDLTRDELTEGNETYTITFYLDQDYNFAVTATTTIIQDTSLTPAYYITASQAQVIEGNSIAFYVTTTNVINNTTLYWRNIGTTTELDFISSATTGTVLINNNLGLVSLQVKEDLDFEINQNIVMTIRRRGWDSAILTSTTVVVGDNTFFISVIPGTPANPISNYNEGQTITYTITAYNLPGPTTVYWQNIGTTTADDFANNINFGTIVISSTTTLLSLTAINDRKTEPRVEGNYETLVVQIRNQNNQVIQTARNVRIFDTSQDQALQLIEIPNLPNILTTDPALLAEYSSLPIWQRTGNIGLLEVGETSELYIKANTTQTFSIVYELVSGSLPEGLQLLRDGTIAGVVTGTNYPSTYNQYNFVAGISKTVGNVIFTSTFQLTLLQTTSTSYTQVYLKPLMLPQNRTTIQRFLTNNDIFEKSYIYRPFDRNFGVSKDLRLYLHYGIEKVSPETIIYYLTNYYRRRFTLTEPKIAYSFNDTNEIIYEVIYSDIIDYNIGDDGISIPSYFEFRNRAFTPSSIDNMRKSLEQNLKFTENFNPKFMKSAQPGSLNKLGYIPCVIYCYTLPGKGKIILNRIKNYGLDFNTIDFDVNQLTIRQLNLPEDIPVRYLNRNGSQLGGFGYS